MSEEKKKIFGSSGAFVPELGFTAGPFEKIEPGRIVPLPPEPVQIIIERWWAVNPNYRYVEMLPGVARRCCVRLYEITEADPPFKLIGEGEADLLHEAARLAIEAAELQEKEARP